MAPTSRSGGKVRGQGSLLIGLLVTTEGHAPAPSGVGLLNDKFPHGVALLLLAQSRHDQSRGTCDSLLPKV